MLFKQLHKVAKLIVAAKTACHWHVKRLSPSLHLRVKLLSTVAKARRRRSTAITSFGAESIRESMRPCRRETNQ